MAKREARRAEQDLRDYPIHTIPEAAVYLGMSRRTLYRWISDNPLWAPAGKGDHIQLLSFNDIAQAHFIEFIRKHAGISMQKAKEILRNAQLETKSPYPLLNRNIKVLFRHILLDKPRRGRVARHVVDLSQHRQLVMQHVVDMFATRIRRNKRGELEQIYPWRLYRRGDKRKPVTLDPNVMSGRLVITGTRIPARLLRSRRESGEKIPALAEDYKIKEAIIKQALRHLGLREAA
jgi:excisionase family DNA binding protein